VWPENCREVPQKSRVEEPQRSKAPPMCSMPLLPMGPMVAWSMVAWSMARVVAWSMVRMVSWPMVRAVSWAVVWRTRQAGPSRRAIAQLMCLVE